MSDALDYIVGGAAGAAEGWLNNQARENAMEAKISEEERQAKLLEMKAAKQEAAWNRRKDREESFALKKLGEQHKYKLEEFGANKQERREDAKLKHNFRESEIRLQNSLRSKAPSDEKSKAIDFLEKAYAKSFGNWDEGMKGPKPSRQEWAKEFYPSKYKLLYGEKEKEFMKGVSDEIDGLISRVTRKKEPNEIPMMERKH